MVRSSVLFFSLICTGHVALGNYIPRYLDKYSSSSSSYPMKASASASTSVATRQSSIIGTEQPLLLNLTDSVIMQVVNHGPNDSKIIIYDHDIQIGETSLDLYPLNITLSGAHNTTRMNMKLLSLDSGEHVLNLIPQLKNGSHLLAQVNAEVRLLPRRQSSLLKRWSSNQDPSQNINETDYNAVVEWSIDTGDSINLDKYSSEEKEGNDGQDDDDDDDDDEDDDGDEDDEDDEDNDEDDDNYSEENEDDEDDEERSWKWNNKAGWKSSHKKNSHKHDKVVKVFISQSDCPVTTPTSSSISSHSSTSSSSSRLPSSSFTPKTSSTQTSSKPTLIPTPTSSSESEEPEPIPEHTITRIETIEGAKVTVTEGRNITVVDPQEATETTEITVLVGRATTTTERETVIANTITFDVATVTEAGQTLTEAGATQTVPGSIVTIAGPPVTFVALTETVTGPGKVLTKYILQQTIKTTVLTQVNDFVTVTQTQYNPVFETVFGTTSTTTENVVVTVVRTQTPTLAA